MASTTNSSYGTHVSDGLRTGPILNAQYSAGANVLNPSTIVTSPADTTPPGIFNTPLALHNIVPAAVSTTMLAPAAAYGAAGALTLITASAYGVTLLPLVNGLNMFNTATNIFKLDTPRNITLTSSGDDSGGLVATVLGYDQYGVAMTENLTGTNASTALGKKAFAYVKSVTINVAAAANLSVGVGNVFGLPYFCPSLNYFGAIMWNNIPDNGGSPTALANNPLTTTAASRTVVVACADTSLLAVGKTVILRGLATTDTITAANLNITAVITAIVANTSFSYVANAAGAAGVAGGGGAAGTYQLVGYLGSAVVASQATATATTGDVRGTYSPSTPADGLTRLSINFYAPSADARVYNDASDSVSRILTNNPIATTNASTTVVITAPDHRLTTGELVTISGAAITNNISAANLNLTNTAVTVLTADTFSYVAGGAANATGSGGGASVAISPSRGNLYQVPIGRFGVAQF